MAGKDAVWFTGAGTINPLGTDWDATAEGLLAGRCGIGMVDDIPLPDHMSRIAGRLGPVPVPDGFTPAEFANLLPLEQVVLWSCTQALQSAGLWDRRSQQPIGLCLGIGAESLYRWEKQKEREPAPWCQPEQDAESTLELVQRRLGLVGPAVTVAAACASGSHALAQARRWIQMGWVDVCLAGGADVFATAVSLACFGNLRALSRRNHDPQGACRPFDTDRDGFVIGEGGAVFVLESGRHARRRGAPFLAEFAGFGASSDAFHMVIPSPSPGPAVAAMRAALQDAAVAPEELDWINAHATSTPVGDIAESKVLATVLGPAVRTVPVSSTKSMTGHLLSGAAAMNLLACLIALDRQVLPPTINLHHPDPECNLCHVALEARPQPTRIVASNSLGFGGSNTCVILRKAS